MKLLRYGHAPGHVRDTFLAAAAAYVGWNAGEPEPEVGYEVADETRPIPISRACDLLWNCTDIIPGGVFRELQDCGLTIGRQTYAACARAMKTSIAT